MPARCVQFRVRGRVQGVFFRESAKAEALRQGLSGYVRNLADGDVEGVAQGEAASVEAFLRWCRKGPPLAQVESLVVEEQPMRSELGPFRVERP